MNISEFLSFVYIFVLNGLLIGFNVIVFENLKQVIQTEKIFTRSKKLSQLNSHELFLISRIMFEKGFLIEPKLLLRVALESSQNDDLLLKAILYFYLGQIEYKLNNFNATIQFLRKSINYVPGFNQSRFLLIQTYEKRRLFYNLAKKSLNFYKSYLV